MWISYNEIKSYNIIISYNFQFSFLMKEEKKHPTVNEYPYFHLWGIYLRNWNKHAPFFCPCSILSIQVWESSVLCINEHQTSIIFSAYFCAYEFTFVNTFSCQWKRITNYFENAFFSKNIPASYRWNLFWSKELCMTINPTPQIILNTYLLPVFDFFDNFIPVCRDCS